MAVEYGGSADGAPNPGVVDGSGDATLGGHAALATGLPDPLEKVAENVPKAHN